MKQTELYYLWSSVAGRCAFPGCNIKLIHEDEKGNLAKIAEVCHIIAQKQDGPRGDPVLSEILKNDPNNVILLCRNHHRIIDLNKKEYTVEHLKKMRDNYIKKVDEKLDLDFKEEVWTGLTLYDTDFTIIDIDILKKQFFPSKVFRNFFEFVTRGRPKTVKEWNEIKLAIKSWWKEIIRKNDISHCFSVFSISYIPIVCYLGYLIRDTTPTKVYQYHRIQDSWVWLEDTKKQAKFQTNVLDLSKDEKEKEIVLSISISAKISKDDIYAVISKNISIIELEVEEPSRNWLLEENQLKVFKETFLGLLDKILVLKPNLKLIHLFAACPTPIAFIIGTLFNPSMFPVVQTYNYYRKETPCYTEAIRI